MNFESFLDLYAFNPGTGLRVVVLGKEYEEYEVMNARELDVFEREHAEVKEMQVVQINPDAKRKWLFFKLPVVEVTVMNCEEE